MARSPSSMWLAGLAALCACNADNCEEEPLCIPYQPSLVTSSSSGGGTPSGVGDGGDAGGGADGGGGAGGTAGMGGMGGTAGSGGGMGGIAGMGGMGGMGGSANLLQFGGMGGMAMGVGGTTTSGGDTSSVPTRPCARGVVAANTHSCAARGDGSIWCWGAGEAGQLGQGTKADSSLPVKVSSIPDAVAFDTFGLHGCAIRGSDDMLWCWGDNAAGQLGDPGLPDSPAPIQRTNLEAVQGVAVGASTGGGFTCALDGSRIRCVGGGESGALGNGTNNDTVVPLEVLGLRGAVFMDAQASHACARLASGGLRCWGKNDKSQLGNLLTIDQNLPVEVSAVSSASTIAVGGQHTCVIVEQGRVKCWGANDRGQLGDGGMQDYVPQAREVKGLLGVTQLGLGGKHTCALRSTGTVHCWGDNERGQLGNGAMGDLFAPLPVKVVEIGPDFDRSAVALSVGQSHACVLLADDTVWCWGANEERQLGDGTDIDRPFPVQVRNLFAGDEDE